MERFLLFQQNPPCNFQHKRNDTQDHPHRYDKGDLAFYMIRGNNDFRIFRGIIDVDFISHGMVNICFFNDSLICLSLHNIGQRYIPFIAEVTFIIQHFVFPYIGDLCSGSQIGLLNLFIIYPFPASAYHHCQPDEPEDRGKNEKVAPFFTPDFNYKIEKYCNDNCVKINIHTKLLFLILNDAGKLYHPINVKDK